MPQDYKTSINNLIIVWQGSSWSVITATGSVVGRFPEKYIAINYASSYSPGKFPSYVSESYTIKPTSIRVNQRPKANNPTIAVFDLTWLQRYDIFRVKNDYNPEYVKVSIAHNSNNYALIIRSDILEVEPNKVQYTNPKFIQLTDMLLFRVDVIHYNCAKQPNAPLSKPHYSEDVDTIYAVVRNTRSSWEQITLIDFYRHSSKGFVTAEQIPSINYSHYIKNFLLRAQNGQPSNDMRELAWNGKPTNYALFVQQQQIEENTRQRKYKNPNQK